MSRRLWLVAGVAVLALGLVTIVVIAALGGGDASRGSSISRGADGWFAARRYLAARGARVSVLRGPLGDFAARPGSAAGTVLVLTFPWQVAAPPELETAIDQYLARGGDLVLAYSGEGSAAETEAGVGVCKPGADEPLVLNPWTWWQNAHRTWSLAPAMPGLSAPLRLWAQRRVGARREQAQVLFEAPGGCPAVSASRRGRSWIVVLPAEALSNGRLGEAGNADLLETLRRNLGKRWVFDEYHHGFAAAGSGDPRLGRVADLLLAHLVLLYGLAFVALARRQGPAWSAAPRRLGSAATFLVGVGALHHRLGHHREAALMLLRRVRELDRGLVLPAGAEARAAAAGPRELVELAGELARLRAGSRTHKISTSTSTSTSTATFPQETSR